MKLFLYIFFIKQGPPLMLIVIVVIGKIDSVASIAVTQRESPGPGPGYQQGAEQVERSHTATLSGLY